MTNKYATTEKLQIDRIASKSRAPVFEVGGTPPPLPRRWLTLRIDNGETGTTKDIALPAFGEVKIITHGNDIRVEITIKEKVE